MLLNGTLSLHDIEDVEAFCIWIMEGRVDREQEDCLAYLISSCWELSLVYDHSLGTFATFARTGLRRRLADWQRQRNGRTVWKFKGYVYERALPQFVPLESRPDGIDHSFEVDGSTYRLASQLGLLRGGGGDEGGPLDAVGQDEASCAA